MTTSSCALHLVAYPALTLFCYTHYLLIISLSGKLVLLSTQYENRTLLQLGIYSTTEL